MITGYETTSWFDLVKYVELFDLETLKVNL